MPPVAKKNKKPAKKALTPTAKSNGEAGEKLAISGQLDKKMKKTQARIDRERGVVIIRHLPHGFFEEQLKNYFQQFGNVTRLRLARSKRTGGSKGFAFVEFEFPEVAKVAAETMDNYLMFQRVVKAAYIPPENQQYNYFKTSIRKVHNKVGKPIYVSGRTAAIQRKAIEYNNWTDEAYQKRIASNLRKLNKLKSKYAHLGIDFDNFTVKPNILTIAEKEEKDKQKKAEEKPTSDAPGSLLLVKKRKKSAEKVEKSAKKSKTEKPVKGEKKIELKDLLENTLQDEGSSDDEEFIPMPEDVDDEDEATSDEESYGILKDADSDANESDTDEEEEEEKSPQPIRKAKSFEKSTKVDRMADLIKRKPLLGGIQKLNKKNLKDKIKSTKANSVKSTLKLAAAKEIKQKGGNIKQLKKADLKKPNKKQRT